jgi:hypothetical protein
MQHSDLTDHTRGDPNMGPFKLTHTTTSGVKAEAYFAGPDAAETAARNARYWDNFSDDVTVTGPDGREVDHREGGQ